MIRTFIRLTDRAGVLIALIGGLLLLAVALMVVPQ